MVQDGARREDEYERLKAARSLYIAYHWALMSHDTI